MSRHESEARLLEVVGEAAGGVPSDERGLHPDTPWPEIIGVRNRLIHGYDSVDFDILWQIVYAEPATATTALEEALKDVIRRKHPPGARSTVLKPLSVNLEKSKENERNAPLRLVRSERAHHQYLREEDRV